LVAATHTPMHADGSLNLDVVPTIVDHLERTGVVGVYPCGTTGEGLSLSTGERKAVAEAYADAVKGRLKLIVHVGHNSLAEARALAAHAQSIGADAVGMLPPTYVKPASAEIVMRCVREVADAAPGLPVYYYHIPALSGVHIRVIDLLRAAETECPQLAGVKFTFNDLDDLAACIAFADGRYNMLFGSDEVLLSALEVGAKGGVGSTYNYAARIYVRVIDAFDRGDLDEARAYQAKAAWMVDIIHRYGGVNVHKPMMRLIGIDCGPYRLPIISMTRDEEKALEADLRETGFFEWIT